MADEAHRLEEVMAEAFGLKVTMWRVKYVMRQALKKNKAAADYTDRAEMAAELFFEELRTNGKLGSEKAAPAAYTTLYDALRSVEKLLRNDPREEVVNLSLMVTRLRRNLKAFYSDPLGSHAYAVVAGRVSGKDPARKPYPELRSWLVETGDVFREEVLGGFFSQGKVLVSATLAASRKKGVADAVAGSFGYARERLGLPEGGAERDRGTGGKENGRGDCTKHSPVGKVRELVSPEIFDYAGRCLIYTEPAPGDPNQAPTRAVANLATVRRSEELVKISKGNTLVLLSTLRAVRLFRESFDAGGYPVRFQGEDSPGRLVQWLRETDGGILVGTRSLWEGVDVAGPALQMVIIDRVTFAPPDDPVIAALVEKAGKEWFRRVTLPKAQVALRQGAGRLMRTAKDRGVIALLDPRIRSKPWGRAVMNSLPNAPVTDQIEDVAAVFGAYSRDP